MDCSLHWCFQSVAKEWSIEAMPTFLFLKEGELVDKIVGADKDKLTQTVEKHAAPVTVVWSEVPSASHEEDQQQQ